MSLPARKLEPTPKRASNLPSIISTSHEKPRVPTLDAHEFFVGPTEDLDTWSLSGLLVTGLAAVVLGASTYVALLTKHVDVPAPVAVPLTSNSGSSKGDSAKVDTPASLQADKTLASLTQGLQKLATQYPNAQITVVQKGHKGLVIGLSESFFFSGNHAQIEPKAKPLFNALSELALASGLRFNVSIETSSFMSEESTSVSSDYAVEAKRAVSVLKAVSGESFLQKRVRTSMQTASSANSRSRISLKLAVSQKP
jgi:hypothetical protein